MDLRRIEMTDIAYTEKNASNNEILLDSTSLWG